MKQALIDSHAHISREEAIADMDATLIRAKEANVASIINICTDIKTLEIGLKLKEKYSFIYNTASTTPHDVDTEGELFFPIVKKAAIEKKLVAIGETGLDYHYFHSTKEKQKEYLIKYLHLALETNLPVVIHCREAFADFFEILDQEYVVAGKHKKGVLHCFTGTIKEAEEVLKRGWYLSLSGIVTFKKSIELQEVAKIVPLDQLLIETDSPYLSPQKHRGKINEPSFLLETAEFVAGLKGLDLEEVALHTSTNAQILFNL